MASFRIDRFGEEVMVVEVLLADCHNTFFTELKIL